MRSITFRLKYYILILLLVNIFFTATSLQAEKMFVPQGGVFYQAHLGASFAAGVAYGETEHASGGLYKKAPYFEVALGTHGYGCDIGLTEGLGGFMAYGGGISFVKINDDDSYFKQGNYFGLTAKGSLMTASLRLGLYYEPKEHIARVNIGLGFGL